MRIEALRSAVLDFNRGDAFFEHLSDDVVLELPFGPSIGAPTRTEGKSDVRDRYATVQASGITISDPTIEQMREDRFSIEYTCTYAFANEADDLPIIAIVDTRGTLVWRIREYWDALWLVRLRSASRGAY